MHPLLQSYEDSIIEDMCKPFNTQYGLGTSFIKFFIKNMISKLKDFDHQSTADLKVLFAALDMIEKVYTSSCSSLSFEIPPITCMGGVDTVDSSINIQPSNTTVDSKNTKKNNYNDIHTDDVSWFFDDDSYKTINNDEKAVNTSFSEEEEDDDDMIEYNEYQPHGKHPVIFPDKSHNVLQIDANTLDESTETYTSIFINKSLISNTNTKLNFIDRNNKEVRDHKAIIASIEENEHMISEDIEESEHMISEGIEELRIWSDQWYMIGLQHCIPSLVNPFLYLNEKELSSSFIDLYYCYHLDSNIISNNNNIQQKYSSIGSIAIPMQWAGEIMNFLLNKLYLNTKPSLSSNNTTTRRRSMNMDIMRNVIQQQQQHQDMEFTTSRDYKKTLSQYIHVYKYPRNSSIKSMVLQNTLVLPYSNTKLTSLFLEDDKSNHVYSNHIKYHHSMLRDKKSFQRIVIASNSIDIMNDGCNSNYYQQRCMGSSLQAKSSSNIYTITPEIYIASLTSCNSYNQEDNSEMQYIKSIGDKLLFNAVDLLIIEDLMVTPKHMDYLKSIGATIVDNITMLEPSDIGLTSIIIDKLMDINTTPLPDHPITNKENDIYYPYNDLIIEREDIIEHPNETQDSNHENIDILLSIRSTGSYQNMNNNFNTSNHSNTADNNNNEKITNNQDHEVFDLLNKSSITNTTVDNAVVISIIIAAPTEYMTNTMSNVFQKSFHQLCNVLNDHGKVMVGGGLPELVCILQINVLLESYYLAMNKDLMIPSKSTSNTIKHEDHTTTTAGNNNSNNNNSNNTSIKIQVLSYFKETLLEYMLMIYSKHGISYTVAISYIHQCLVYYQIKIQQYSITTRTSDSPCIFITNSNNGTSSSYDSNGNTTFDSSNSYHSIITSYFNSLTIQEKEKLKYPIQLSNYYNDKLFNNSNYNNNDVNKMDISSSKGVLDDKENVLDLVQMKINALNISIIAIKQIVSTVVMVDN